MIQHANGRDFFDVGIHQEPDVMLIQKIPERLKMQLHEARWELSFVYCY